MTRRYTLAPLQAMHFTPPQLVALSADVGAWGCGVRLLPVTPGAAFYPLHQDAPMLRETLACMADRGVTMFDLELVRMVPGLRVDELLPVFDVGQRLGARVLNVIGSDPEPQRLVDTYGALCDAAARFGLSCDVEPVPWAPGHTGAAHDLAESVGAVYGRGDGAEPLSHAFWAPVSLRNRRDGSTAVFPHFVFDRAKPGTITVDGEGRRFLNESTSYHLFGIAMQAAHRERPSVPACLITDAEGLRKYGLGMGRPKGMGLAAALADGYVTSAGSVAELARKLGLPEANLVQTIERFNGYWQGGTDPEFGRGTTAYQRANGDATWRGPNPSLGPVDTPPYYAVRLYPGDIGAATGFATDADARVLDRSGTAIPGLYAAGNDMQSIMGGVYPAPGITLGPGLVFAYIATRHAVARGSA